MTIQTPYLAIPALVAAFYLTRTIYRLYFHPLSKFPGPKLTAATGLVEIYHDVIRGGKFLWEIEKMHEKYGISTFPFPLYLSIYTDLHCLQAPSSASPPTKSTSKTPPTMTPSTQTARSSAKTPTSSACSVLPSP